MGEEGDEFAVVTLLVMGRVGREVVLQFGPGTAGGGEALPRRMRIADVGHQLQRPDDDLAKRLDMRAVAGRRLLIDHANSPLVSAELRSGRCGRQARPKRDQSG